MEHFEKAKKKQKRDKKREVENKTKMGRGQVNECSKGEKTGKCI